MCSAAGAIHDVDHSRVQFVQCLGGEIECLFRTDGIGSNNFVIECLHLLDESRLIKRAAVRHDPHGLGHLQWGNLRVALADGQVCDVTIEQFAAMRCLHVFIIRNTTLSLAAQWNAAFPTEAQF